jgi:hypothetical protein
MIKAASYKIDAFALNMANNEGDGPAVALAFTAADQVGFKLFFSFDYAGGTPAAWALGNVTSMINTYKTRASYYKYNNKPLVSTFEGPGSSNDWVTIKSNTGCTFFPDWSSLGVGYPWVILSLSFSYMKCLGSETSLMCEQIPFPC